MSKPVYIQLQKDGRSFWHLVEVKPLKRPLLERLRAGEPVDVSQLGRVLKSGWGQAPKDGPDYENLDG